MQSNYYRVTTRRILVRTQFVRGQSPETVQRRMMKTVANLDDDQFNRVEQSTEAGAVPYTIEQAITELVTRHGYRLCTDDECQQQPHLLDPNLIVALYCRECAQTHACYTEAEVFALLNQ